MEFKQLEIFVELVEKENFSVTAAELGISQPTVSLQLKQLEDELDTPLFIRSTRELKLTEEGRNLYKEAKELLSRRKRIMNKFFNKDKRIISIGVSTISGSYLLPNILEKYCKDFPDIKIEVEETNSLETIKKVEDYQVDLGIVGMEKESENCKFHPIYEDEFVFICPNTPYYRQLKESNPTIKELAKEPLIIRESGSGIKDNMDKLLAAENLLVNNLNAIISINDEEVIKKLVANGLGTSFISKVAVEDLVKEEKILMIELTKYKERFRNLYVAWNKKVNLPSYVNELLEQILE